MPEEGRLGLEEAGLCSRGDWRSGAPFQRAGRAITASPLLTAPTLHRLTCSGGRSRAREPFTVEYARVSTALSTARVAPQWLRCSGAPPSAAC